MLFFKEVIYWRGLGMRYFRGFVLVGMVVIVVTAFSLVAPAKVGELHIERANLWSGLLEYDDADFSEEFSPDFGDLYAQAESPSMENHEEQTFWWDADSTDISSGYRIAFLGDSFIEGDILTSDLREMLQSEFGGRGVGFVPCELPFKIYRHTAKVHGSAWQKYSLLKHKTAPEGIKDSFLISGYLASGGKSSEMIWERGAGFAHLDSTDVCRIFLLSDKGCSVEVSLSGGQSHTFDIGASPFLRQIVIKTTSDRLKLKILSGSLLCYGASFESSTGVHIDNFSMRSNNGGAMFRSNLSLNRQFAGMMGYDAVVLQYGLNIMMPDKNNYSKYQKQLENMIECVRLGFPESEIVVMGVTDRGVVRDGDTTATSINSAPALTSHQKAAADNSGVLFWNSLEAMESLGGLETFAQKGWVASDKIHFTFGGGRALAGKMSGFWDELIRQKVLQSRKDTVLETPPTDSSILGAAVSDSAASGLAPLKTKIGADGPRRGKKQVNR